MFEKKFKVKLNDGFVDCKTYSLREYLAISIAKTNASSSPLKEAYSNLIKNSTNGKDFAKHDAELILINLLANSENEDTPTQEFTCTCGESHKVKINVKNAYVDYGDSNLAKFYPFKKFKIELQWPKLWDDDDIPGMIAKSIKAIYVGTERLTIDDLSDVEITDLYSAISEDDINNIKKILLAPKPILPVAINCPHCGKSHVHVISGFKEFLEVL